MKFFKIKKKHPIVALLGALVCAQTANAQFSYVPMPLQTSAVRDSQAETPQAYAADAARVIYGAFPLLICREASLETVLDKMEVEIVVGPDGKALDVRIKRAPTLDEIVPWVQGLIKRIERFPAPVKLKQVVYRDVWMIEEEGMFRLGSLADPGSVR